MLSLTFDEVEAALLAVQAPVAAAEGHGALCGALVSDDELTADAWLAELAPQPARDEQALRSRNLLQAVFDETRAALGGQDLEFEPLLPDEAAPLETRVAALAAWCGGFLYGFGAHVRAGPALPEDVGEVVKDFAEISKATLDTDETEESSESSYAEIVEYVRAGTQLAYEELAGRRERAASQ